MLKLWLPCLVLFTVLPAGSQTRTVALTFDDLPLAGAIERLTPAGKLAATRAVNTAIFKTLRRHHAPAVAFVNEGKVIADGHENENRAILRDWIRQGGELGNHTYSHADLNSITVEQFEKEIVDGEPSVRSLMVEKGKPLRYFRFPFNHTGETVEKHDGIAGFLQQHGYQLATCTIENTDWMFTRAYELMLARNDTKSARRLRTEYLEFTRKEVEYYVRLSEQIFGHEIPQVMLLHANRLNADTLDQTLKIFEKLNYRFITLEEAQADPAYKTPDTFLTAFGLMWPYRWAKERNIKIDGKLEPEEPAWVKGYK
jgi:peptidoglycan/xylan/chitin deacetylase (PgdA/CDA1 family)